MAEHGLRGSTASTKQNVSRNELRKREIRISNHTEKALPTRRWQHCFILPAFLNKNRNTHHQHGAHLITTEQTSVPATPHIYSRAKYSSNSSTDGSTRLETSSLAHPELQHYVDTT